MTNTTPDARARVPGVRSDERGVWGSARRRAHGALQVRKMRNECCMLHERMHGRNGVAHGARSNARDGACTAHDARAPERCATRSRCCAHEHQRTQGMLRNKSGAQRVSKHAKRACACTMRMRSAARRVQEASAAQRDAPCTCRRANRVRSAAVLASTSGAPIYRASARYGCFSPYRAHPEKRL